MTVQLNAQCLASHFLVLSTLNYVRKVARGKSSINLPIQNMNACETDSCQNARFGFTNNLFHIIYIVYGVNVRGICKKKKNTETHLKTTVMQDLIIAVHIITLTLRQALF